MGFGGVIWAWYVVNFILNAGKHSYGAGEGGQWIWLVAVAAIQLLFMAVAVAPGDDRNRADSRRPLRRTVAIPNRYQISPRSSEPGKNRIAGDGLRVVKETLIALGTLLENSIHTDLGRREDGRRPLHLPAISLSMAGMIKKHIGFIGAGQMATALGEGFVRAGLVSGDGIDRFGPLV